MAQRVFPKEKGKFFIKVELLVLTVVTVSFFGCGKKCDGFDPSSAYHEVCDLLNAKEMNVSCDKAIPFEGQEIGVVGKLDPDYLDYLNDYQADLPDTWPSFFRILDSSAKEGDKITSAFVNEKVIQINLWNDGVNPSSFEPLKQQLEVLFENKAFHAIRVKGIARGFNKTMNVRCTKGVVIELSKIENIEID